MKITFEIEYLTRWGEVLRLEIDPADAARMGTESVREMRWNDGGKWTCLVETPDAGETFRYRYSLTNGSQVLRTEWGDGHRIRLKRGVKCCRVCDRWSDRPAESAFRSSAFTEGIFARSRRAKAVEAAAGCVVWRVEAPAVRPGEVLALAGELPALGGWDAAQAAVMSDADYPVWSLSLRAAQLADSFSYKFVVLDAATRRPIRWEEGDNRLWRRTPPRRGESVVEAGLRISDPGTRWRGAGVAVPVFSLRSEESFGVGDFYDLKKLVDWAASTGMKMIQILPINDTTMSGTWQDSYPYNANSTFALHPQFLRPEAVGRLKDRKRAEEFRRLGRKLNALDQVDYEAVNGAKNAFLREIFAQQGKQTLASDDFRSFFERNRTWLEPYAAFCVLRDRFRTADFTLWGDYARYDPTRIARLLAPRSTARREAELVWFTQYHLHRQLVEVRDYAHERGVVLKGDIPIGISRTSADAWVHPTLFRMNSQAGAPPDDFSVQGQNWGFPTYDWEEMARDGYAWWKARFRKMAEYFDAYRIDHILGFFRIWEIPLDAAHGLLGHFNPALPFSEQELRERGFWFNATRHATPYVYDYMLGDFFDDAADEVRREWLNEAGYGRYTLREQVATQRRIEALFAERQDERSLRIRDGLMGLLDEVLFVPDPEREGMYHPRISAQFTYSYRALSDPEKAAYDRLYNDFFYRRHNDFWREEAMRKLPPLISATRMLVCGEDLGMIPRCVPEVMDAEQILSLEIQRMPKDPQREFGDTRCYPYRSVCTTSTHDMSTLRAWWEEDRARTQRFFNEVLGERGAAPWFCEPWVCERIVGLHLASPAMLTVLPLQDWLSIDGALRRENPSDERINVPAVSRHYWRYRMHLTLERLLGERSFNDRLRTMIASEGR